MISKVILHTLNSCHNCKSGEEKKTVNGTETELDGRPHCFALRLQKPAVDFFRTLSEDIRKSYDETVKSFWISRLFCFRFLKRNFYSCSNPWLSFNYCGWQIFDLKCNRIFFEFKKSSFSAFEQILQCQITFPVLNVRIWMRFDFDVHRFICHLFFQPATCINSVPINVMRYTTNFNEVLSHRGIIQKYSRFLVVAWGLFCPSWWICMNYM